MFKLVTRVYSDSLPDDQEPLTLSINSKGEIYIQEHQVTYQKMIPKLLAIAKNRTIQEFMLGVIKIVIMEECWK